MSDGTDRHIDQLVKARWLAIGLSQTNLAEVLDAAFQQKLKDDNGSNAVDAGDLTQIAQALDIPVGSLQSLLALRLLRAFQELTDQRTKEVLVQLAEKIVERQANRRGDAG
jgi:transcriptional regulator with XRE-family HTH domain